MATDERLTGGRIVDIPYEIGLHEVADGVFAYLQPDGGWGWSNAGLLATDDGSLLVDTLFDQVLTRRMLDAMAWVTGTQPIGTVVNTHANGDHTHGNGLCTNAEVIASEAGAKEMEALGPNRLQEMMQAAPGLGETGKYFLEIFGSFDFGDIAEKLPTKTFNGEMQLSVGDKRVDLVEVGPAHTQGDVLVFVPDDSTVFTGDILFIDGTPIMWVGPVRNWLSACDLIIERNPDVIVPGHGPITDINGVRRVKEYLAYIDQEAAKRYEDGMSAKDAALDISVSDFESWTDAERIAVNVATLYSEYSGSTDAPDTMEVFALMAEIKKAKRS